MEVEMFINQYGNKIWHKKGNKSYLHREDGPAKIDRDGWEFWWYHDIYYDIEDMPLNLFISYCKWEYRKIYGN